MFCNCVYGDYINCYKCTELVEIDVIVQGHSLIVNKVQGSLSTNLSSRTDFRAVIFHEGPHVPGHSLVGLENSRWFAP